MAALRPCDQEPITRLERIQPFGFLLAVYADGIIARASDNLADFVLRSGAEVIGHRLEELIEPEAFALIRERQARMSNSNETIRLYGVELVRDQKPFDIALHRSGFLEVIEGEISGPDDYDDPATTLRNSLAALVASPRLSDFHSTSARSVRKMAGFDRVFIYCLEDTSGKILAEDIAPDAESFLGLRYPASDIPSQARELYLRNPFRIIPDITAPPVRLNPFNSESAEVLDLSLAITRAVSPIHLEYLRNMGVAASLSISIVVAGKLWGLVVCHHLHAKLPRLAVRTALEAFGQMYSLALEPRLKTEIDDEDREVRLEAFQAAASLADGISSIRDLAWVASVIEPYIQFDGLALMVQGQLLVRGRTPETPVIRRIMRWLGSSMIVKPFSSENFEWQGIAKTNFACRGLFAIPLANSSQDFILLFRREEVSEVIWAGDPNKASWNEEGRPYLSPRMSFKPFVETVAGQARAHTSRERRAAEILREALSVAPGGQRPSETRFATSAARLPEITMAELHQRLPAIFALVRGLVPGDPSDRNRNHVADYCRSLGARIEALAMASDQLADDGSKATSLQALIQRQAAAHEAASTGHFLVLGPEQRVLAEAVLPIALVIYELLANTLSRGALSVSGNVDVRIDRMSTGLNLVWRETGAPARRPEETKVGAELDLCRRIVADDLQGTSQIEFFPGGMQASFWLPERHSDIG